MSNSCLSRFSSVCRGKTRRSAVLCLGALSLFASALKAEEKLSTVINIPLDPVTNTLGMRFVAVPATPVLFSIWETRVKDFGAFLDAAHYSWSFKPYFEQTGDHPVVNITLQDALAFCNWLTEKERQEGKITDSETYRLPTNEEWDAAVGLATGLRKSEVALSQKLKDSQSFPWGQEWPPPPDAGNLNFAEINGTDDHYPYTAPVGQFRPNPFGLFDMAGNAWEWTWDQETKSDAQGTLRGGSWMYFRKECLLSSYQYQVPVDTRAASIGFRVVLEDKRRKAQFLIAQKNLEDEIANRARQAAGGKTEVTQAEIEKMRESLALSPAAVMNNKGKLPDAAQLHPVKLGAAYLNFLGMNLLPLKDNLFMGDKEVRLQDYEACMTAQHKSWDRKPSFDIKPNHPIVNVTWQEAKDFCDWLTQQDRATHRIGPKDQYRLPTDAEWSWAVGLHEETGANPAEKNLANRVDYPWGRDPTPPPLSANLDSLHLQSYQDNYPYTAPVGSFSPNTFGYYDLAGNAAEWCADAWPDAPKERVVRGSSWLTSASESMLSSYRQHLDAATARPDLGFRVLLEVASSDRP